MQTSALAGPFGASDVAVVRGLVGRHVRLLPAVGADAERSPGVVEDRVCRATSVATLLALGHHDVDVHLGVETALSVGLVLAVGAVALREDDRVQLDAGIDVLELLERSALDQRRAEHAAVVPTGAELDVDIPILQGNGGTRRQPDDLGHFLSFQRGGMFDCPCRHLQKLCINNNINIEKINKAQVIFIHDKVWHNPLISGVTY
jgi:hypothetical protein